MGFNKEQVLTGSVFNKVLAGSGWVLFNKEQALTMSVLNSVLAGPGLVLIRNSF